MGDKYNSSLEDATKLKFAPFCCSSDTLSNEIIFGQSQNIHFQANNHGLGFDFWESSFGEKDAIGKSISRGAEWHKFQLRSIFQ